MSSWTKEQDYYLKNCKDSGVVAIAYATKKSPTEVLKRAKAWNITIEEPSLYGNREPIENIESLDDLVLVILSDDFTICPKCGTGIILPWGIGSKHGVCDCCEYEALYSATEILYEENLAKRAYEEKTREAEMVHA